MPATKQRILIVEDSLDIQAILGGLLESEGYEVTPAHDGTEALAYLHAQSVLPSLILLDLMMPKMDGYELCEELVKTPRFAQIPVVVMTADGDIAVKSDRIGAQAFLKKPFLNLEIILNTIKRHASNE